MIVTMRFDTSDVDENEDMKRFMAAEDMTAYIWSMQEYIFALRKRGDFDEDGYRLLDLIIGEMEHQRSAIVEAALDTWT